MHRVSGNQWHSRGLGVCEDPLLILHLDVVGQHRVMYKVSLKPAGDPSITGKRQVSLFLWGADRDQRTELFQRSNILIRLLLWDMSFPELLCIISKCVLTLPLVSSTCLCDNQHNSLHREPTSGLRFFVVPTKRVCVSCFEVSFESLL